ncbi:MAG: hypothetical protein JST12_13065 [Armatimonadetes bacterium]|nr:hypothetical protein [Armatimonadota bacterium]
MRRSKRNFGGVLVTVLVIVIVSSMIVAATLMLSAQHYSLGFSEARSESALLLAEGGINDELTFISKNIGNSSITSISSQPVAANGETAIYPGEGSIIKGRKGSISGTDGNFWVYTSQDQAGTTGWDGKTSGFWITARSYVRGSWRKVQAQVTNSSIFSLYAVFALANYGNSSPAISLQSSDVIVVGTAGTNGIISNNSSYPYFKLDNGINANRSVQTGTGFSNTNLTDANAGAIYVQNTPVTYPLTSDVLSRTFGLSTGTDPWTYISGHSSNATGVYTFRSNATGSPPAINTSNCQAMSGGVSTTLSNSGGNLGSWANAGTARKSSFTITNVSKASGSSLIEITLQSNQGTGLFPTGRSVTITGVSGTNGIDTATNGTWAITLTNDGTGNGANNKIHFTLTGSTFPNGASYSNNSGSVSIGVRTLIFEPGDYYFNNISLPYNSQTDLYIDPNALASGGTPGQVRFWINDTSGGAQNDNIQLQVNVAGGLTDPSLFRIYVGKKGKTFQFSRPSNPVDYLGTALTGDFNVYGGVYAVCNAPGDASSGSTIIFDGPTATGSPRIVLTGSLLADSVNFNGNCKIVYNPASNPSDPVGAGIISGGYNDGG